MKSEKLLEILNRNVRGKLQGDYHLIEKFYTFEVVRNGTKKHLGTIRKDFLDSFNINRLLIEMSSEFSYVVIDKDNNMVEHIEIFYDISTVENNKDFNGTEYDEIGVKEEQGERLVTIEALKEINPSLYSEAIWNKALVLDDPLYA